MIEMSDLMQELACAVRQKNFERAEEALSVISARCGHSRAIAKGRRDAVPHAPTLLDVPNVVTIHDLPSREGIEIVGEVGWSRTWRRQGAV